MKTPLQRIALLLLIAAFAMLSTSCNTLRGAGRDVQNVGSGITRAAS